MMERWRDMVLRGKTSACDSEFTTFSVKHSEGRLMAWVCVHVVNLKKKIYIFLQKGI